MIVLVESNSASSLSSIDHNGKKLDEKAESGAKKLLSRFINEIIFTCQCANVEITTSSLSLWSIYLFVDIILIAIYCNI